MRVMWPDLLKLEPAISGYRPEKILVQHNWLARLLHSTKGLLLSGLRNRYSPASAHFVSQVKQHAQEMERLDEDGLRQQLAELRQKLRRHGFNNAVVARSFALIREVAGRNLGLRHYDNQLIGGWLLLGGVVTEMSTGEGKTLTATLAAGTAALAGLPVHVLTVNDYLTARDAQEMAPLYRALGLSTGVIVHETGNDERCSAYGEDILYCTSKEIVFDFLRDRIVLGNRRHALQHQVEPLFGSGGCHQRLLMRGLHFAIVDEVDSVLIDEARTPLIISGEGGGEYEKLFLEQSLEVAKTMQVDRDFTSNQIKRQIKLTSEGKQRIEVLTESMGSLWSGIIRREEAITQALSALRLFKLDEHYLVRDDKVEIIDPLSGRISEGRSWDRGLHQLIELKEGCELTQQRATLAKISYQRFFKRYLHLTGMTGTAHEVRNELWRVYELPMATVPDFRPSIREVWRTRLFFTSRKKWQAIAERVRELQTQGRAVLIGTGTVRSSELGSEILTEAGLNFRVLNAKQDEEEADIIAMAGEPGCITIATSMAGRGTDIKLADSVSKNGGLHVILSEHYDAARVDRQLAGRCARQGDPGSFEVMLSLDDAVFYSSWIRLIARAATILGVERAPGRALALIAFKQEQRHQQRHSYRERMATQKYDQKQGELLSISGVIE